eukprot:7768222-Pyramimonas_sp.AAC.1
MGDVSSLAPALNAFLHAVACPGENILCTVRERPRWNCQRRVNLWKSEKVMLALLLHAVVNANTSHPTV